MWLSGEAVHHGWRSVKNFVGNAWHEGGKLAGQLDNAANLGMRLFGAASPYLGDSALGGGLKAVDAFARTRGAVQAIDSQARSAVGRFRSAVPELGL